MMTSLLQTIISHPIPRGRSIAHQSIANENADHVSFDIEVAGEAAGMIQISVVIVWI